MEVDLKVLTIPEGAVLVLPLDAFDEDAFHDHIFPKIVEVAGHLNFVILHVAEPDTVLVWGPDEDHAARLRALVPPRPPRRRWWQRKILAEARR